MADRYASLKQGLVGAWIPSISGSGLLLPDLSGRGNHGVLTNMGPEDWVSGQYGRALDFDGTDDNVLAATGTVLKKSVGLTITAWVKRTSSNQKGSFFKTGANTSGSGYGLAVGANNNADSNGDFLNLLMEGIAWVGTGLTMSSQRWEHVAIVITPVSGGTANAFLNGVSAGLAYNNGIDANTTIFLMGGYAQPLNRFFYGQMDDVRTYNRALTESEIRLLASRPGIGLQPSPTRLIAREKKTGLRRKILTGQT